MNGGGGGGGRPEPPSSLILSNTELGVIGGTRMNAMAATKWQILKLKFEKVQVEYPGQFEPNQ